MLEDHFREIIIGLIVIIAVVIATLNKYGFLNFAKPCDGSNGICPEPDCKEELLKGQNKTLTKVIVLETGQKQVIKTLEAKRVKINKIAEDVAFMRGKYEG